MVSKVVSLFVFALLVNNFNFIKKNKLNKWKIKIDTIPFLFSSNPKNFSFFFIHRSSIRHWKKGWALLVNSSNYFIDMSVLYQINSTLAISRLKNFETNTNVVVERVPLFAQTSSSLALTVLMVSHYWSIENQSKFTNESRNAMVLPYDF
jgi:hypothetical protein